MRKFDCKNCGCHVNIEHDMFEDTFAELWGAKDYCTEKCYVEDTIQVFCPDHGKMEFRDIERADGSIDQYLFCSKCKFSIKLGGRIPFHEVTTQ